MIETEKEGISVGNGVRMFWDWLAASDPGLTRLRMGFNAAVAMGTGLGVEYVFARVLHTGGAGQLIAMMLGAVTAMMGGMALAGLSPAGKLKTAAFFPAALGVGIAAGILTAPSRVLTLSVFVVVMFLAVAVRQLGPAYFFYGFMGWIGYFLASLTHLQFSQFPFIVAAVIVASAWIFVLSATVLRTRRQPTLRRTLHAFETHARAMAGSIGEFCVAKTGDPRSKKHVELRGRAVRLSETALMVEGWAAEPGALPAGWTALALRRFLFGVQHVMDRMVGAAAALEDPESAAAQLAGETAQSLSRRQDERAAQILVHFNDIEGDERWAAVEFSNAAAEFLRLAWELRMARLSSRPLEEDVAFEPAAALASSIRPSS